MFTELHSLIVKPLNCDVIIDSHNAFDAVERVGPTYYV